MRYGSSSVRHSFLDGGAGKGNRVFSTDSSITAGGKNTVDVSADYSAIVAGHNNLIDTSIYNFIGGGGGNTVSGQYSAILGGSGNTISAAFTHAGIFGQGITAVASNTFHVECLNAVNTPIYTGLPYPVGTLLRHALPAPALGLPAGTTIMIIQ